ncbi:MAG: hypothetical protein CMH28_09140 [Micavibrio sp.]|nr:hypothetical protein [Micavibrio sp.]
MTETYTLNLVVPCYNPLPGWQKNLITCFNAFQESIQLPVHLILVNDGSVKGVSEIHIDEIKGAITSFTYHTYKQNRGKGFALREGLKKATSDWALTTDIDFPYENESMVRLAKQLENKGGLVLGHRKRNYYQKVPLFRKMLSVSFRVALKTFLRLHVDDTQCGLKGMGREAINVFLKTDVDGYLYDLQLVTLAQKENVSINRVEVQLKSGIEFTNMKVSVLLKELGNFLKILLKS